MNTMPPPLRSHWDALEEEVVWLHGRWKIYRQLYGTSPERIELLNESAAAFFFIIQAVLIDNVQLTLGKLADRPTTRGQTNLTLEVLLDDIRQLGDTRLYDELDDKLKNYRQACTQVIHRRHKQLAHFDLATLMNAKSTPLPGPSRQEIEDALSALRSFMNALQRPFTDAETSYDGFILTTDGDLMLSILKQGLRYQELVEADAIDWNDLQQHSKYFGI